MSKKIIITFNPIQTSNWIHELFMKTQKEFTGCDGLPWNDEFLKYRELLAIEKEDYEFAAKCRDELKRRNEQVHVV